MRSDHGIHPLAAVHIRRWVEPGLLMLLLLVVWEVSVAILRVSPFVLPRPSSIAMKLVALRGPLLRDAYVTTLEALGGTLIAALFGLMLAVVLALFGSIRRAVEPLIAGFQSFPKEAIAPVLIVWMGFGYASKMALAASIAFFPSFLGCFEGIRSVPGDVINVMTGMKASRWEMLVKVQLRYALPSIFVGLRIAWTLGIIGAVVSEFIGASAGLGHRILLANSAFDLAQVFVVLLVLAIVGLIGERMTRMIGARCSPWFGEDMTGRAVIGGGR